MKRYKRSAFSEENVLKKRWIYHSLLSGVLTLFILVIGIICFGMWPFGEKTILTVDMYAQYAPLLSQFRSIILNGSVSTYSFNIGIGTSFLPLFAYYLASPMNLLFVLFPDNLIAEAALLIIILKVSLASTCFCIMLEYLYERRDIKQVAVALMYSLSMYVIAYSWCIMWLDSIIALPLLVVAFERMMRTKKYAFFVFTLVFSICVNYYLGFMIGIFMVLYFGLFIFRKKREVKQIGKYCSTFFIVSVIGLLISAALLLPVYLSLTQTSAAASLSSPHKFSNFEIWKLLGRSLFGVEPTIRSKNLPNIYCGVLSVVLFILFNTIKQIPFRRRVAYSSLMILMFLSLILNPIDLFWHGMHSPNDLPYRESFIYCFVSTLIAYETLIHIKSIKVKNIIIALIGVSCYIIIDQNFSDKPMNDVLIYVNLLLLVIYCFVLMFVCKREISVFSGTAIILMVVMAELTFSTVLGFNQMDRAQSFALHKDYVDNKKSDNLKTALRVIKLNDENLFYRVESLPRLTCVDTALFNYKGITTFASSNSYDVTKFMKNLGYQSNGVNSYLYKSFVAPADSIFGIKYLVTPSNITGNRYLSSFRVDVEGTYIYENNTALPLGFLTGDTIKNYKSTPYNPFKSQMDLYSSMGYGSKEFYNYNSIESMGLDGDSKVKVTGKTSFKIEQNDSMKTNRFKSVIQKEGQAFAYIDCTAANSIKIESGTNKWDMKPNEPFIIDLGSLEVASEVFINIESKSACSGNVFVTTLDDDLFRQSIVNLRKNPLYVTRFSDSNINAYMKVDHSGIVFTSIPYDEGWKVKIDEIYTESISIDNGLLAFEIPEGEHSIEIKFEPKGLKIGLIISISSVILFLIFYLFMKKTGKRNKDGYDSDTGIQRGRFYL